MTHDDELTIEEVMLRLFGEAKEKSGRSDMNTMEMLKYLSERGNMLAFALLDKLTQPEENQASKDIEAAMELHPAWEVEQPGHYRCIADTAEDTPDKVLEWYRMRH